MKISSITFAALLAVGAQAHALSEQPTPAAVAAKLHHLYPQRQFGPVAAAPIPGLFEVVTGDQVAYVDASGAYMIFGGKLFDMNRQVDLTEQRLSEVNKIDAKALPLGDAVKTVRGDGSRVLYVFTDPNCPYCKRLESESFKGLDNVTIYEFLYPILRGSKERAEQVWCAADRAKAWSDWMVRGASPAAAVCVNPLERNLALGRQLHVSGTPTMFTADGRRITGAVSATAINAAIKPMQQ